MHHSVPHPLKVMASRMEPTIFKCENADYAAHESLSALSVLIGLGPFHHQKPSQARLEKDFGMIFLSHIDAEDVAPCLFSVQVHSWPISQLDRCREVGLTC